MNTRTTLAYGQSGLGKTSQVEPISIYVAEQTNQPTLLITADPGGYDPLSDVLDAGLVEVFDLAVQPDPMPTLRDIFQGKHKTIKLEKFGAIAWEGLTSTAFLCLRNQTAKGRKISEDPVGEFSEGGRKFAAPARSLYLLIQQFMMDALLDLRYLPSNIKHVYVTAHESKGIDLDGNSIYGPALVGKAGVPLVAPAVGDLLHFDTITLDPKKPDAVQFVAWFRSHYEGNTRIPYLAKPRTTPSGVPKLQTQWPKGYFPLSIGDDGQFTNSVVDYWKFLEAISSGKSEQLKQLIKVN
jgi:hypothetical protein